MNNAVLDAICAFMWAVTLVLFISTGIANDEEAPKSVRWTLLSATMTLFIAAVPYTVWLIAS